MIRKSKEDSNYTLVEYKDILLGLSKATKINDSELTNLLKDMYSDADTETEMIDKITYKRIHNDNKLIPFLKEEAGIIDYDKFITADILKDALARSYYEFNHEMKNKLSIYFRKFVDNEINGISNDIIKNQIINDKELLEYIKKYDNFAMYIEEKINRNIDMREKIYQKRG